MTLREKQSLFARLLALLIVEAEQMGYRVTLGEAYRTAEQAAWNAERGIGIADSLHCSRLAIDLNLFELRGTRWVYLTSTESHRSLGEWWERQDDLCRWGGRFDDGNHYSLTHGGRI